MKTPVHRSLGEGGKQHESFSTRKLFGANSHECNAIRRKRGTIVSSDFIGGGICCRVSTVAGSVGANAPNPRDEERETAAGGIRWLKLSGVELFASLPMNLPSAEIVQVPNDLALCPTAPKLTTSLRRFGVKRCLPSCEKLETHLSFSGKVPVHAMRRFSV